MPKSHGLIARARFGKDGRVTIPASIRRRLKLRRGSVLAFEEIDGAITIRKSVVIHDAFTRALETTRSEWNSAADDEAFRDL
jgi:antitoxin PrlF